MHYSQTGPTQSCSISAVLEVYRIALLSNIIRIFRNMVHVLEVYRIALLSNNKFEAAGLDCVLEVYRIALLSNRYHAYIV